MIKILTILILFSSCIKAQKQFGHVMPPQNINTIISGEFINNTPYGWEALDEEDEILSFSNGWLRVQGQHSGDTQPDGKLNIVNIGYGASLLQNYTILDSFKINAIDATSFGVNIGVRSITPSGYHPTTYGNVDFVNNRMTIYGADENDEFTVIGTQSSSSMPAINTSDDYSIKFDLSSDVVTVTFYNLTAVTSKQISFTYNFSTSQNYNRPNVIQFAFGVSGTSDVSFRKPQVTTDQKKRGRIIVWLGDSITEGYFGGSSTNSFAQQSKSHTSKYITQVMAGGGNTTLMVNAAMTEILNVHPQIAFVMLGTNDGIFSDLQNFVNALTAQGIQVIPLLIPNGGNPATGGTFNNSVATTYPSTYIDTWTTGWNTMSEGNGEMFDALHPTSTGETKILNIILAARSDIFPL